MSWKLLIILSKQKEKHRTKKKKHPTTSTDGDTLLTFHSRANVVFYFFYFLRVKFAVGSDLKHLTFSQGRRQKLLRRGKKGLCVNTLNLLRVQSSVHFIAGYMI